MLLLEGCHWMIFANFSEEINDEDATKIQTHLTFFSFLSFFFFYLNIPPVDLSAPPDQVPPRPGTHTPLDQAPPRGQTHTCKHITLPQTSFAGSNVTV